MAEFSSIEWCDATFNPWIGCRGISPACDHCYAEALAKRTGRDFAARTRTSPANWKLPLRWNARAHLFGECECGWRGEGELEAFGINCPKCMYGIMTPARRRVFCASLADVFDNAVDPAWRADLFALIAATPNLDWQLLTKRIGNAVSMIAEATAAVEYGNKSIPVWSSDKPWPNVWIGATVCNQAEADRDIPKLLRLPAAVRFLSIEPMLGPISFEGMWANPKNMHDHTNALEELDWVIVGGESGHGARPMHLDWPRDVRDQCASVGVPFFMKQMGGVSDKRGKLQDLPEDLRTREYP